jgi:CheY-like chemotaxis protein
MALPLSRSIGNRRNVRCMPELVLVVEDDAALTSMLSEALTTDTTLPLLTRSASDAVREIDHGLRPDAILIDLDMSDGIGALALACCAMEWAVPVIALSSSPRRLVEAGIADAVLMKPIESGQLREGIDRACASCRGAL